MDRALPEDTLAAFVAQEAPRVLDLHGHAAAMRKRDDRGLVGHVADMLRSRPVARLAASRGEFVPWVQPEHSCMNRVRPVLVLELMAGHAPRLAEVTVL